MIIKAEKSDLEELVSFIQENGLSAEHVSSNFDNFYLERDSASNRLVACGCYVYYHASDNYADIYEIRSVVVKPEKKMLIGTLTVKIVDFILTKLREIGARETYAVFDGVKNASFVRLVKRFNGFEDAKKPLHIIPRYRNAGASKTKNKVLLVREL